MRTAIPLTVLATALACSLASVPAHARARVFVASYGNDSNPCSFGSPCRNFQQAVNVVDAGGEVTAIDSAGFGPILITKAVSITSPNGVEAGIVPVSGGNRITINAGPFDAITLSNPYLFSVIMDRRRRTLAVKFALMPPVTVLPTIPF